MPPVPAAKQTVEGLQSSERQHGCVQKLELLFIVKTGVVTSGSVAHTPLSQNDGPAQSQPSPRHDIGGPSGGASPTPSSMASVGGIPRGIAPGVGVRVRMRGACVRSAGVRHGGIDQRLASKRARIAAHSTGTGRVTRRHVGTHLRVFESQLKPMGQALSALGKQL